MAYNETLAERIRGVLRERSDATERKMFGGIAFMVRGHMCCGIVGDDLMLRIGEAGYENALKRPHVRPMDFTGRPMKGMIYVDSAGSKTPKSLKFWLEMAVAFAESLPDKKAKSNVGRTRKKLIARKAR
jgi:TfoX/Sxy family transcriptional regulator of competence genes